MSDEEFQYTEERPAYGPQGRWTQLRTERDAAVAAVAETEGIIKIWRRRTYEEEARANLAELEVKRLREALTRIASSDAPLSQDDMRIAREALER
jgi:hypothetical protein